MTRRCPNCAETLRPTARFCPVCGTAVSDEGQPAPAPSSSPALIIRVPGGEAERRIPLEGTRFTLGRAPDNEIVLAESYVSSHHGRLEFSQDAWHYVDLDSTNGTYINGRKGKQAVLHHNDILRIGDPQGNSVSLTFEAPAEAPAPGVAGAYGTVMMGSTSLRQVQSLTIGRDPHCDLHLQAPVVSGQHARLDRSDQGALLVDLGSTNGTYVNGQRLTRPHPLEEGDVVQIGPFTLIYAAQQLQQYATTGGVRLDGLQLVREVGPSNRRKRILKEINISIAPREFVALVGTSGAGKSTLMMALNGFARADGQVLLNGDDLYQHFDLYRTMVGYVPQDDIIHRELTVANALRYAARLRLPPDTSREEVERRVDDVLEQVEMIAQKEQPVSSLSGGQRKRVSIAVELLAEPNLFFLDEPTSGLDPGLEKKMMLTMRRLADGGRTVVLVTHATANIVQCDHVCFLSQGRMVFFGPPADVFDFFGVTSGDFADVYGQLDDPDPAVAQEKSREWEERFRASPYYQQYVASRQQTLPQVRQEAETTQAQRSGPKVNVLRQFAVLTRRYIDLVMRDKLLLSVLMAVMPIIGALVLLVAGPNWLVGNSLAEIERQLNTDLLIDGTSAAYSIVYESQVLLFTLALASILLGLFASVYEIVKERSVYRRERMVTLRILPYLASKLVVLGGFALIQCFLLLLVIGLKVDLPQQGVLLPGPVEIYVTLFIGTLAAIALGLIVSAVVPNVNSVIYIVFLLLFFQFIFAGVLFDLPGLAQPLSNLTLMRWSVEGLGVTTDVDYLNTLTRTRFQPDPVTEEVTFDAERPSDDWEPITVVTVTEMIDIPVQPGLTQTVPISVPQVTENPMITVTETLSEVFTVTPDPVDIFTEETFQISYERSVGHLVGTWGYLGGFGLLYVAITAFILRRKDLV